MTSHRAIQRLGGAILLTPCVFLLYQLGTNVHVEVDHVHSESIFLGRHVIQKRSLLEEEAPAFYQVNDELRFLHMAFLDDRFNKTHVRIFGMQNKNVTSKLFCRFYFDGGKVDLKPEGTFPIYPEWPSLKLKFHAYYYGCTLPSTYRHLYLQSLSVFVPGSKTESRLPLQHGEIQDGSRKSLALCVKAIWGRPDPVRLVEWIEMNRILGVEKIIIYDSTTTGPAYRVLRHYVKEGFLELIPFKYILNMMTIMRDDKIRLQLAEDGMMMEQAYLVSMNDCMYRYRLMFKHIMVLDIDEVIVPTREESLPELISRAFEDHPRAAGLTFHTAWHLPEMGPVKNDQAPAYMFMQRYLNRSPVINSQPKTIVHSDRFITVNWHSVVTMPMGHGLKLEGNVHLDSDKYGNVHHFRYKCKHARDKCDSLIKQAVQDEVIPRYRDRVKARIIPVLEELMLD